MSFKTQISEIIKHFGLSHQKRKFVEEGAELFEAITEMQCSPSRKNLEHVIEEMADTFVVWRQFAEYYNIEIEEILTVAKAKAERTIARIKDKTNFV